MNARTEPLIAVWSGPFLSRLAASKLRSIFAELLKAVGKIYRVGILVYFAAAGVQAMSISDFSVWLSYMGQHAVYALAWPIVVPIEISSERGPSSLRGWADIPFAKLRDIAVEQHRLAAIQ